MGTIGIVVNPNSGKDIRRLVTHATMIDNLEKVNILCRIIMGIGSLGGNHDIYIIPDRFRLGRAAMRDLQDTEEVKRVQILDMVYFDQQDDTTKFTEIMVNEKKADVMIVMGGDGTSRAVAKAIGDVPLIAVSTGTNNVYPTMLEGTSVGFAAAAIASGLLSREDIGPRGKRIDIQVADRRSDIALVDAVFSTSNFVGARAILRNEEMDSVLVTQCHPANIGFSSLAGTIEMITPDDDYGMFLDLNWNKHDYICAISAGVMLKFGVDEKKMLKVGESITQKPDYDGTVAVDGEREVPFRAGDDVTLTLTRNGPRKVDVRKAVELGAKRGMFKV
ncbi:MAG: ATP-NAD kinase [Ruminococcaceae bacterium]|nr:ATP-NAD kinase [Oscillospiraceae bacterium]